MILTTRIYTKGDRIDYDYNVGKGIHSVWFANNPRDRSTRGSAGQVIEALTPYQESNKDVMDLIAWLTQFPA